MAIDKLGSAAASAPLEGVKEGFGKLLENAPRKVLPGPPAPPLPPPAASAGCPGHAAAGLWRVGGAAGVGDVQGAQVKQVARAVEQVNSAQARLDRVLQLAQSGRSFTPAELIALQAQVYRASQQLDLAGKVVEKATSGIKQVLQTQV